MQSHNHDAVVMAWMKIVISSDPIQPFAQRQIFAVLCLPASSDSACSETGGIDLNESSVRDGSAITQVLICFGSNFVSQAIRDFSCRVGYAFRRNVSSSRGVAVCMRE